MKRFHAQKAPLMILALALQAVGCSSGGDIEAKIGGRELEIETYQADVQSGLGMGWSLFLASWEGRECDNALGESSFSARLIFNAQDIPLDTPIDIVGEGEGDGKGEGKGGLPLITAIVDAKTESCGYSIGGERTISGTVTFTELSETYAEGSVDLRVEGAHNVCGSTSPTTLEYKWSSFTAPSHTHVGCE